MGINELLGFKTTCKNAAADKNSMNILPYESKSNSKLLMNNIFKEKAKHNCCSCHKYLSFKFFQNFK
jgi:hypothetical protein